MLANGRWDLIRRLKFNGAVRTFAWIETGKSRKRILGWPKEQLTKRSSVSVYQDGTCFVKFDRDYRADGPV